MSEELLKREEPLVPAVDLKNNELPNLHTEGKVLPVEIGSQYWSPEEKGEFKLGFLNAIELVDYPDRDHPEILLPRETVFLLSQNQDGSLVRVSNASKRLVAEVQRNFKEGKLVAGCPVQITYMGTKLNKTNPNKSAQWSIKPIALIQ